MFIKKIKILLFTILLFAGTNVIGGEISMMWEMPTEREDDTKLSIDEIAFTKVYFHDTEKNHWTEVKVPVGTTDLTVDKPAGTYEIFATVFDTDGRESQPSRVIKIVLPDDTPVALVAPNPPNFIVLDD